MAEATIESIALVRRVTRRLVIAISILLAVTLIVAGLASVPSLSKYIGGISTSVMVCLCGSIGGFVSIQRRLKKLSRGDLELFAKSWIYIVLAPMVGAVLALLAYLLFVSGLLENDLFPRFVQEEEGGGFEGISTLFAHKGVGFRDYAKLLVWAFVAGFSETFVTNIIGQFEKSSGTDGFGASANPAGSPQ